MINVHWIGWLFWKKALHNTYSWFYKDSIKEMESGQKKEKKYHSGSNINKLCLNECDGNLFATI